MNKTSSKDIDHQGELLTVLRSFMLGNFFVVQGKSMHSGLYDNYREFSDYSSAIDYFNFIKG